MSLQLFAVGVDSGDPDAWKTYDRIVLVIAEDIDQAIRLGIMEDDSVRDVAVAVNMTVPVVVLSHEPQIDERW